MKFLEMILLFTFTKSLAGFATIKKAGRIVMAMQDSRKRTVILESLRVSIYKGSKSIASTILTYTAIEAIPDVIIAVSSSMKDEASAKDKSDAWKQAMASLSDIGWLGSITLIIWGSTTYAVSKRDISLFAKMQQRRKGSQTSSSDSKGKPGGPGTSGGSRFKPNSPKKPNPNGPSSNNLTPEDDKGFITRMRSFVSSVTDKGHKVTNVTGDNTLPVFIRKWNKNSGDAQLSSDFLVYVHKSEKAGRYFKFKKGRTKDELEGEKIVSSINGKMMVYAGTGAALTAAWLLFLAHNNKKVAATMKAKFDDLSEIIQEIGSIAKNEILSRHIIPFYNMNNNNGDSLMLTSDEVNNKIAGFKVLHLELLAYNEFVNHSDGVEHMTHVNSSCQELLRLYNSYDAAFFSYIYPVITTIKLINEEIRKENSHTLDEYLNSDGSFVIGDNNNSYDKEQLDIDLGINDRVNSDDSINNNPGTKGRQIKPNLPKYNKKPTSSNSKASTSDKSTKTVVNDSMDVHFDDVNIQDLGISILGRNA